MNESTPTGTSTGTPGAAAPSPRRWLVLGATAVVSALGGAAVAGGAVSAADGPATATVQLAAQTSEAEPSTDDGAGVPIESGDAVSLDCEAIFGKVFVDGAFIEEWTPTEAEIAEINAESQEIAALLDAAGAAYELQTDDLGLTFPEPADEAGWEIVDQYYEGKHGDMVVMDEDEFLEEYQPTAEELAEWQTEADEIRALLDAAGVQYETVTEFGLTFPEPADDAGWAIVDEYLMDKYGDVLTEIDGFDELDDPFGEMIELTDEEIQQLEDCEKEFFSGLDGCELIIEEIEADEIEAEEIEADEIEADDAAELEPAA